MSTISLKIFGIKVFQLEIDNDVGQTIKEVVAEYFDNYGEITCYNEEESTPEPLVWNGQEE